MFQVIIAKEYMGLEQSLVNTILYMKKRFFRFFFLSLMALIVPGDHSQGVHGSGASAGHHILHGRALPVPGHLPVVLGESGRGQRNVPIRQEVLGPCVRPVQQEHRGQ